MDAFLEAKASWQGLVEARMEELKELEESQKKMTIKLGELEKVCPAIFPSHAKEGNQCDTGHTYRADPILL